MKISDVVRMALVKSQKTQVDLQKYFNLSSPSALGNKLLRGSWSANDLARVAEFTGGDLIIRYPDGTEIAVRPEEKPAQE